MGANPDTVKQAATPEGRSRYEFAKAWAAAHRDQTWTNKDITAEQSDELYAQMFQRNNEFNFQTDLGGRYADAAATFDDPAKRAAFLSPRSAAAAKPDKTDTYLRGIGIKRRTGSMQNSFIGRAFDPSAPIGRGNLLGD